MGYFDRVQRFCFFLSSDRSGHSILAHLLTAHPDILISDELNALQFLKEEYTSDQVFALIKYQDYRHQKRRRQKSGYNYWVDGASQNIYDKYPIVIGDAKGSSSITLLSSDPNFINQIRTKLDIPIRAIVHIRNPLDIIATRVIKKKLSLKDAIDDFIEHEKNLSSAYSYLSDEEKLLQHHEDIVNDTKRNFTKMFNFLNVYPDKYIIDICAKKIWKKSHKSRNKIRWSIDAVNKLHEHIKSSDIYSSYKDDLLLSSNLLDKLKIFLSVT